MNDANKRTLLDWFKELKINKLLNVNIGGMTSGAGLATEATLNDIKTSVQIVDDWDESDRAKVNPIVGQTGIAAGAGVVDAKTTRVVTADVQPSQFRSTTVDEVEEDVNTSPCYLLGYRFYNPNASEVFVKFCNATAANTTVGSTAVSCGPILIPAGAQVVEEVTGTVIHYFNTACSVYATTLVGDTDTTAPTSDLIVEIYTKTI